MAVHQEGEEAARLGGGTKQERGELGLMGERWHQGGFFLEALIASFSFATYVSTFPSPTSDNNKSVLPAPFPTFCPRKDGLARWRQKRLWIRRKVAETWKKRRSLKVGILHRLEKNAFVVDAKNRLWSFPLRKKPLEGSRTIIWCLWMKKGEGGAATWTDYQSHWRDTEKWTLPKQHYLFPP